MTQTPPSFPSVAVCLAVYNGTPWISEQLDSILMQQGVAVTVFVSVDASTDGSEDWIDERAANDARIKVLPHGRRFGCAARNFFRILHETDFLAFDYVGFADQDDIWLQGKFSRAHAILCSTAADAYSSNIEAFWPDGRKLLIKKSYRQADWDFMFESAGPGCTYVMKGALVVALKDLLARRWEEMQKVGAHDWFIYAFARAAGFRWIIDDHVGMLYRQHGTNEVGVNSGWRAFAQRARVVVGGWGLAQSALTARLVGLDDDQFIRRGLHGGRGGLLWLASHAGQCRRRGRDKVLFAASCVVLCFSAGRK